MQGDAARAAACAAAPGRAQSEDRFVLAAGGNLLAVIDGLGGHEGGALAASLAAEAVQEVGDAAAHASTAFDAPSLMRTAFAAAEARISRHARGQPAWRDMGVAMVMVCVRDAQLCVAHIGDARAYLGRGGRLLRLTDDHPGVGQLLRAGLIEEAAAGRHPARQPLLRVVGNNKQALPPEFGQHVLQPQDVLLLCSDGVWAALAPETMAALLASATSAAACARALVQAARDAGGADDACAVVGRLAARAGASLQEASDAAAA